MASRAILRRTFLKTLGAGGLAFPAFFGHHPANLFAGVRDANQEKTGISLFTAVPPSESKIFWTHVNGRSPEYFLPETTGAGCAFLDYDNDGWMDIYLVNSGPSDFYTPAVPLKNGLFRNNRDGTFTDVTDKAGVAGGRFGMGVAAADYDGDGNVDL